MPQIAAVYMKQRTSAAGRAFTRGPDLCFVLVKSAEAETLGLPRETTAPATQSERPKLLFDLFGEGEFIRARSVNIRHGPEEAVRLEVGSYRISNALITSMGTPSLKSYYDAPFSREARKLVEFGMLGGVTSASGVTWNCIVPPRLKDEYSLDFGGPESVVPTVGFIWNQNRWALVNAQGSEKPPKQADVIARLWESAKLGEEDAIETAYSEIHRLIDEGDYETLDAI